MAPIGIANKGFVKIAIAMGIHYMGKQPGSATTELLAFHRAVLRRQRELGKLGVLVSVPEWESYLTKALSRRGVLLTRQSCQDKTWALERLGLIRRVKGEGVIVLEVESKEFEPEWKPAQTHASLSTSA